MKRLLLLWLDFLLSGLLLLFLRYQVHLIHDSACCNHMTSSPDVVPSHTSTSLPTIYTANGSPTHVSHLGNVSIPALSVSNVY